MRPIILLLLAAIGLTASVFAQTPSKAEMHSQITQVVQKLNATIADLEKQIADAKKNKEDTANIANMETQLAKLKKQVEVMGGVTRGISRVTDKTIKTAVEGEGQSGIAVKDESRINTLPKKTLTDAELLIYVQKVQVAFDKRISVSQKKNAKQLYDEINSKEKSPGESGNNAMLCWLAGSNDMALWIMGKACVDDPTNADNLSNYASLLSMVGGEHIAVPIFENLAAKFPGNTTIMNNLGQAWYGLGDKDKAKQYLSGTVRLMAAHPYANETICGIAEAENDPGESIESMKRSLKEDYTTEKEAELTRRGYHVKFEDFEFKYPIKA